MHTTIETLKAQLVSWMMTTMKQFTKDLHMRIGSFDIHIGERINEASVLDLFTLRNDVATLRSKVHTLVESDTLIIYLIIVRIVQPLPTLNTIGFLFILL